MKINILRVAKGKITWADIATENYLKRIQHHWKTTEQKLKLASKGEVFKRRQMESKQILSRLGEHDRLIVLDERGDNISSEQLAGWLETAMVQGTKRIVFAIGGPFGHDPELRKRAWKTLALSSMVLNHEIARLLLAEQLYRASTIIYGGQYHH
jgi:23S rRNA (pseudouridine1915-N3)-methyltransferase